MDFDETVDRIVGKVEAELPFFEQALAQDKSDELPEIFGRMTNRAAIIKKMHRRRKEALEQTSLPTNAVPMDYDFMIDCPLDMLFPFGQMPPMYGQYN